MADHDDDHGDDGHGKKKKGGGHGGGHGGGDHDGGGGGHGAPLWVVSFCDMTILEMSFFIILLSGASQKTASDDDLLKILASIKAGFGYVPKSNSNDELDIAVLQVLTQRQKKGTSAAKSQLSWSPPALQGQLMKDPDQWVRVKGSVGKPVIFEENSAEIPLNSEAKLDEIATVTRNHYRQLVIQGHCSPTEAQGDSQGGHDLSFRRAMALKSALEARGIASARIRIVSCASHDTFRETQSTLQRRAVVTLGTYYLPGGDLMENLTPPPGSYEKP